MKATVVAASWFIVAGGMIAALAEDADAQSVVRVSVDSSANEADLASTQVALSADGLLVAFASDATNLVPNDTNGRQDIFLRDRSMGTTERVSVDSAGAEADGDSYDVAISADGAVIAFTSTATNLIANDTNLARDVFVHVRATGVTERVSIRTSGREGNGDSSSPALSADGRFVAFASRATNLVAHDDNHAMDVFVRDRVLGTTTRVSVDSSGGEANGDCSEPAISRDGNVVAFSSYATNLVSGDNNWATDVFVHDRTSNVTECESIDGAGAVGDSYSSAPELDASGTIVVFETSASNLFPGDNNRFFDVVLRDRATGTNEVESVDSAGIQGTGHSLRPTVTPDGRFVAFESYAPDLVPGDANQTVDVFVRDRSAKTTSLVSMNCVGGFGDDRSFMAKLSDDAGIVGFVSVADDLVPRDHDRCYDVFVFDVAIPPFDATATNYGNGFPGTLGVPSLTSSADPVFNATLTIDASNSSGTWSVAMLLVGADSAAVPTSVGGTLLVDVAFAQLVGLPPTGLSVLGAVPPIPDLTGVPLYLQVLELDPGAAQGVSFTPGLQLVFGH